MNVREAPGRATLKVQRGNLASGGFSRTRHISSLVFLFLHTGTHTHTHIAAWGLLKQISPRVKVGKGNLLRTPILREVRVCLFVFITAGIFPEITSFEFTQNKKVFEL